MSSLDGGSVICHANQVQFEYQLDSKDALKYLVQQHAYTASGMQTVGGLTDADALDTATLWQGAQAGGAFAGDNPGVNVGARPCVLSEPFLIVEWYQPPETVSIPPQVSIPCPGWEVYTEDVLMDQGDNRTTKSVSFTNLKFESYPALLMLCCSAKQDTAVATDIWNEHASSMDSFYAPIDFDNLRITMSTKSNVLARLSKKEWYTSYKEVARRCCISEEEWYRYKCVAVLSSALFGKPKNVYDPFTLSLTCPFYRAEWEADGDLGTAQNYTCKLIAIYPQALSIAENAASMAALRVSQQQLDAALGGAGADEEEKTADDFAQ